MTSGSTEERLAALERRVAELESFTALAKPLGLMPGDRHLQKSWACKHPEKDGVHRCSWRSCGCACHVKSETNSSEKKA